MRPIPSSISGRLSELAARKGFSPEFRRNLDELSLYVIRAFSKAPTDPAQLAKAAKRAREALAIVAAGKGSPVDADSAPQLAELLATLEIIGRAATEAPTEATAIFQPLPAPTAQPEQPTPEPASTLATAPAPPSPVARPAKPTDIGALTLPMGFSLASVVPRVTDAPPSASSPPPLPAPAALESPVPLSSPPWPAPVALEPLVPLPSPPVREPLPPAPPPIAVEPPPLRALKPPLASTVEPPAARSVPHRRPSPVPDADSACKNVASLVAKLASLHGRRLALVGELLAPWGTLVTLDEQIAGAVQALGWLGAEGLAGARLSVEDAGDTDQLFGSTTALLQAGARELVLARLGAAPSPVAPAVMLAFRVNADVTSLEHLVHAGEPAGAMARVLLLQALAERGRCPPDALVRLLDDPDDRAATLATTLLAWTGDGVIDAADLRRRARDTAPARRCALLFAAVALGSWEALLDLRVTIDAGAEVTATAVDALAIAGGTQDAERLMRLAARRPELAPLAVLAAAHLGDVAALEAIDAAEVEEPLRARARRTVEGPSPPERSAPAGVRVLYGEPWTASRALARLTAPDELLRARAWYALELAVRSGVRPRIFFDATAPAALQASAADQLRAAVTSRRSPLREGTWSFWGAETP